MDRKQILTTIQNIVVDELLEDPDCVTIDRSLTDLGANSLSRREIIVRSMQVLGVEAPLTEVNNVKTIGQLVDYFAEKLK